jgi:CheY-like chemotaxis protein
MNPKIILLVEDNPSDIGLTQRALAKSHVANELVVAEDGQEALDYLFGIGKHTGRDVSQAPALVLLDLKLPRVDGLEVLRQIRLDPRTSRLPVVILTTSKEELDVAQSYDLGANSYIRKPVDFTQFAQAVEHLGLYWLVLNEPAPPRKRSGTTSPLTDPGTASASPRSDPGTTTPKGS